MTHITYDDKRIELDEGQTVLSALLDNGYEIPNSCRAGACQSCMMQATEGDIPESSQIGIKDTLKAQGFFLACSCTPNSPIQIASTKSVDYRLKAEVIAHDVISTNILRLKIKPELDFNYIAGQFINIWKDDNTARSYSLASVKSIDDFLELHIRRIENGAVSDWLHNEINIGDNLSIQEAAGDCFYISGSPAQKILLAGTGTGLAPLIGIARDALQQNHTGEIQLIHGTRHVDDLYLHHELINMSQQYPNFHYQASVLQANEVIAPITTNAIDKLVVDVTINPSEWKAYLCGDEGVVNTLKKKLFLAGASMSNIYTDAFISATD